MHPSTRLQTWFALQSHRFAHNSPYILSGHCSEQFSPNVPFGHSIMKKDLQIYDFKKRFLHIKALKVCIDKYKTF